MLGRVRVIGDDTPSSTALVPHTQVEEAIARLRPDLERDMKQICHRFERRAIRLDNFRRQLGFLGSITSAMYGVKIETKPKERAFCQLKRTEEYDLALERIRALRLPAARQEAPAPESPVTSPHRDVEFGINLLASTVV